LTVRSTNAPARWFHRQLEGYEPTPLLELDALAEQLGIERLWCKVEAERFGLPSFKVLGASWAAHCALRDVPRINGVTLVAATEGNHGRAVAHAARWFDAASRIYVPAMTSSRQVDAIAREGAEVVRVDGNYDDAVDRAHDEIGRSDILISDVARDASEDAPRWVIEGYATIMDEVASELVMLGEVLPDLAVAQTGVGSFAASVVRGLGGRVIGVEAAGHACVSASLRDGIRVSTPEADPTVMSGLNCATPSAVAWDILRDGLDCAIEISDAAARRASAQLAEHRIVTTPTGAAGLAGLAEAIGCGLVEPSASALIFVTEGPDDR
jgi:diaminopropionate ammonia-lyase